MKILRKPLANALFVSAISAFYAAVFILTPGHAEFERILSHARTLQSDFWNGWSEFLRRGSMKYVGFAFIAVSILILLLSCLNRRGYDEYQAGILGKAVAVMGAAMVVLFPVALLLILSDPGYCAETLMLLVAAHWSVVLAAELVFAVMWVRS